MLNEFAQSSDVTIWIREADVPLREEVKGACEILGLDPLCLVSEGKLVAVVPERFADNVSRAMRAHALGREQRRLVWWKRAIDALQASAETGEGMDAWYAWLYSHSSPH